MTLLVEHLACKSPASASPEVFLGGPGVTCCHCGNGQLKTGSSASYSSISNSTSDNSSSSISISQQLLLSGSSSGNLGYITAETYRSHW